MQSRSRIYQAVSLLMVAYVLILVVKRTVLDPFGMGFDINEGYACTEFLINYEGGFVRRGLLGSLIYAIVIHTGIYAGWLISITCWVSMAVFVAFFVMKFRQYHLCWWLMALSYTAFGADFFRKDFLCMDIVIAVLFVLRWRPQRLWVKLATLYGLTFLLLNLHEAFFFVVCPFMAFYLWHIDDLGYASWVKVLLITPPFVMFMLLVHFHGDAETAVYIQNSWHALYPDAISQLRIAEAPTTNSSIGALAWSTSEALCRHLDMVYGEGVPMGMPQPYGVWVVPIGYVLVGWVVSRFVYMRWERESAFAGKRCHAFTALLLFQFVAMLPLFVGLSCDIKRICMYWTMSSLAILLIWGQQPLERLMPETYVRAVAAVDRCADRILKPLPWRVVALMLFVSVPSYSYTLPDYFLYSPVGVFVRAYIKILM